MPLLSGIIIIIIIRLHLFQPLYHRCMSCCCTLGDPEEVRMALLSRSTASLAAAPHRWKCMQLKAMQDCQLCPAQQCNRRCTWEGFPCS